MSVRVGEIWDTVPGSGLCVSPRRSGSPRRYGPQTGISLDLFTHGFEMMYKAWHRRGALFFFYVIHQISRSHETKNLRFWPEFSVSGLSLKFEITDGFKMVYKAWCSIEEVPYYFSRSPIKFQGRAGRKIDLNLIWVRLLDRSQLSNPSDLPCCIITPIFTSSCTYLHPVFIVCHIIFNEDLIISFILSWYM